MSYDVVTMEDCSSNYGVFEVESFNAKAGTRGGEVKTYTVSFNGSEGPAHCTCPAFKYSKDQTCKHCAEVWEKACMYNPQWHDATENPELRPKEYTYEAFTGNHCACGGPLVSVRRAV